MNIIFDNIPLENIFNANNFNLSKKSIALSFVEYGYLLPEYAVNLVANGEYYHFHWILFTYKFSACSMGCSRAQDRHYYFFTKIAELCANAAFPTFTLFHSSKLPTTHRWNSIALQIQ